MKLNPSTALEVVTVYLYIWITTFGCGIDGLEGCLDAPVNLATENRPYMLDPKRILTHVKQKI